MGTSQQDQVDGTWKMSVGQREASLLALEKAIRKHGGSPFRIFENFRANPVYTDRIAELMVHGGYLPTEDQKRVRAILPKGHFFGVDDWRVYFTGQVDFTETQLAEVPKLPWSEDELRNPGVKQPEFVFLVPFAINGEPVTLETLNRAFPLPGKTNPRLDLTNVEGEIFTKTPVPFGWHSVIYEGLEGSEKQKHKKLPDGYINPKASTVALAEMLFYLLNGKYANPIWWLKTMKTKNFLNSLYRVCVKAPSLPHINGVKIQGWLERGEGFRIAVERKID